MEFWANVNAVLSREKDLENDPASYNYLLSNLFVLAHEIYLAEEAGKPIEDLINKANEKFEKLAEEANVPHIIIDRTAEQKAITLRN